MDWWWIVPLFAAGVGARWWRTRRDVLLGEVLRTSWRWRLPLSRTSHEDALRRTRTIAVGDAVGSFLGVGVGVVVALVGGTSGYPWPIVLGLLLGLVFGSAVAAAAQVPAAGAGPRVAHARDVTIDDLQPRWLTASVWAAPVVAAGAAVLASVLTADPWSAPESGRAVAVCLGATVLALVGFVVVRRRALRAPRRARTDLELAWQDGFVARSVVEASVAVVVPALAVLVVVALPGTARSGIALVPPLVLVSLPVLAPWTQRTFRRRLWNDRVFELAPEDLEAAPGRS